MKIYLSTIFLTIFSFSYSQIKLEGYVKDSLGNGLELANVIAINKATSALDSYGITNEDGRYKINLKKNKIYSIKVSNMGMKSVVESLGNLTPVLKKDLILKEKNLLDKFGF